MKMKNKGKMEDPDWKWKGEKMDILNEVILGKINGTGLYIV